MTLIHQLSAPIQITPYFVSRQLRYIAVDTHIYEYCLTAKLLQRLSNDFPAIMLVPLKLDIAPTKVFSEFSAVIAAGTRASTSDHIALYEYAGLQKNLFFINTRNLPRPEKIDEQINACLHLIATQ